MTHAYCSKQQLPTSFPALLILYAQVPASYQTSTSISLLHRNSAVQLASGEVMRGGDGMEVIMATETTKVKKMDDNGTVKGKEYSKRAQ